MSTRSPRPSSRTPADRPLRAPAARGREVRQQRRRVRPWQWMSLAALAILVGGLLIARQAAGANLDAVQTFGSADVERGHKPGQQTYRVTPPVGGVHNDSVQNCGIYDQPVGNEYAVHSLEHGAVWITYRPDLPQDQVDQLRNLVRGKGHVLLSPYPGLPAPIVASAWGVQLRIEGGGGSFLDTLLGRSGRGTASDPRLGMFLDKYVQGTQTPEPGATCRGGMGSPLS